MSSSLTSDDLALLTVGDHAEKVKANKLSEACKEFEDKNQEIIDDASPLNVVLFIACSTYFRFVPYDMPL